ncbi:hypothetical protein [Microbacterium sp. TNHR37B]|jgi:hypothetical protein|uniref:hypothetical protein n=1 Tax=unclassified Microbacterium TaxID=2609290 RepID=UPI0007B22334|nr:hypothetical protein [Microbacterium sp. TNHR37B]KZE90886.1 hypothetical protein AVP41_00407 [Microbacterium sp. TNHR37B]
MRTTSSLSLLLVGGLAVAALTGCSGQQSVADACKIAESTVSEVQTDVASVSADASAGEFSKVSGLFDTLKGKLDEASGKITNEEVKTAVNDLSASVDKFATLFDGLEDGDMEGLSGKLDQFEPAATAIQDSSTKLGTLCSQ